MSELLNNSVEPTNGKISTNEIRITIKQPTDVVFEYVLEPVLKPEWCRNISEESVDTEQIGMGTIYSNNFGELKVTDYERNVYFELSEIGTEYRCSYSFKRLDDNVTEIIYFEGMLDGSELLEPMEVENFETLKSILER